MQYSFFLIYNEGLTKQNTREGFTVYGINFSKSACDRLVRRFENENLSDRLGGGSC